MRAFAAEDPRAFLAQFPRGVIIDKVQRVPDLPSYLKGMIDADPAPGRWILTGSHNLALLQSVSQSLAGRTAVLHLLPLCRGEVVRFARHPRGISQPTAKAWLSILEAGFVAFRLPAFHSNLRKRLVKMPKLHFYDTGLVCWLLGIRSAEQLRSHPLRGPIFGTWVSSEIVKHRTNQARSGGPSFHRDRNGAEVDFLIDQPSGMALVETKSSATPSLGLLADARRVSAHLAESHPSRHIFCVYGGDELQQRNNGWLVPWSKLHEPDIGQLLLA